MVNKNFGINSLVSRLTMISSQSWERWKVLIDFRVLGNIYRLYHPKMKTMRSFYLLLQPLFTLISISTNLKKVYGQRRVEVGDTICVNGYVMDYTCIERGRLFDNPSVHPLGPNGPVVHTIHCLIDVPVCVNSPFEILYDVSNGKRQRFGRAWRVDDNNLLIEHAKRVGICDEDCRGNQERGLTATVIGKVLNLGNSKTPALLEVEQVGHGNIGCGDTEFEVPNMIL